MWAVSDPKRRSEDQKKVIDKAKDNFEVAKDSSSHKSITIVYVRGPINCITVEKLILTLNETLEGIASEEYGRQNHQADEFHVVTDDGTELLDRDELQESFQSYPESSPEAGIQGKPIPEQKYQNFLILDTGYVSSFDHLGMLHFMVSCDQRMQKLSKCYKNPAIFCSKFFCSQQTENWPLFRSK